MAQHEQGAQSFLDAAATRAVDALAHLQIDVCSPASARLPADNADNVLPQEATATRKAEQEKLAMAKRRAHMREQKQAMIAKIEAVATSAAAAEAAAHEASYKSAAMHQVAMKKEREAREA